MVALVAGCSPVQRIDGSPRPAAERPDATNNAEATALTPVTENGVEYNSDFVAVNRTRRSGTGRHCAFDSTD